MKKIRIAVAVDSEGQVFVAVMERGHMASDTIADHGFEEYLEGDIAYSTITATVDEPKDQQVMGELARPDNG